MQDIDFDEIDRAVSSVTGKDSEVSAAITTSEPTPEISVPTETIETLVDTTEATAIASPAARRSTGRFMDVVHPSSDMRPNGITVPSPRREEAVPERAEVVDSPEEPVVEPTAPSTAFHWPDPIEVAESAPVEETPAPEPVVEELPPVAPPSEEDLDLIDDEDEEAAPLESPFLTDAKVEKRPLGAFSTADTGLGLPLLEDFPAPTAEPALAPAPEIEQETSDVPAELHPDLLLLDTHGEDDEEPELLPEHTETAPEDDIPAGPTSITQQYTEQPSTASQPSGAIFDTEAYHQPLAHTVKKRSGVTIIIWIVALVLVGGGLGAGIYFVVLPMLG
ncbi:MAG: hypothetical protein JWO99_645 [Candidatus Saccharibacteria bacterium]|nr:hypothetical protein [Candidatus Saccharibacteria bacterium]